MGAIALLYSMLRWSRSGCLSLVGSFLYIISFWPTISSNLFVFFEVMLAAS